MTSQGKLQTWLETTEPGCVTLCFKRTILYTESLTMRVRLGCKPSFPKWEVACVGPDCTEFSNDRGNDEVKKQQGFLCLGYTGQLRKAGSLWATGSRNINTSIYTLKCNKCWFWNLAEIENLVLRIVPIVCKMWIESMFYKYGEKKTHQLLGRYTEQKCDGICTFSHYLNAPHNFLL